MDTVVENANEGIDTLDFSALSATTPVTVNLASATTTLATMLNRTVLVAAAGQAANFENVLGGAGNDTITGNAAGGILSGGAGNDTITGGSGRSVLLGGLGADSITGGSGDDILIDGTTSYDKNLAALLSFLAEWQSANDYQTRVSHLRNGGGLNGSNKLTAGTTVKVDTSADVLTGNAGLDWFFANLGPSGVLDNLTDLDNGGNEHVNNN
jgi:Ca2+-binding RTX toxin-like protein